jgi:fibro-slime domain-containing protein
VTDSAPPADAGDEVGAKDSGLPVDAGAGDVAYVAARCGDGIVALPEQCDDGNTVAGDGCSPTCKVEIGHKCSGSPSVCTPTICGDGIVEGAESCDDGNTMPFDGCSEDCQIEPDCSGASCISKCGDGIVIPPEQCDDGNNIDGDGCAKDCTIEPGFTCSQPPIGEKMMVPVIYRDFRFSAAASSPNDFENGVTGQNVVSTGMVNADLDKDGKPVYANPVSPGGAVHVASTASFATWFRTSTASPPVNHATASKLALWSNGNGGYVNRYGANGEQWNVTQIAYWCGTVGQERLDANGNPIPCTSQPTDADVSATDCEKMEAQGYTQLKCYTDTAGTTYQALYITAKVDGNPLFFPVDSDPFSKADMTGAQIPSVPLGMYDASATWPWDLDAKGNKILHNFSFTSEVRYWFKYEAGKTYQLDFVGDDDVWVFINKKLAVDLGGIHTPVKGSIILDATIASTLGLVNGRLYEVAVFQAERQTTCSSYQMTLSGFNAAPSECAPCTDGIMAGGGGCASAAGTGTGGATGSMTGVPSGGASTTGGKGGVGGNGGAGGSSYIGASGITTSPFAGNGGAGGTTDTSDGGIGATGGAGASSDVTPPPVDSLAVWVDTKTDGSTGKIALTLRIDNKTSSSVDMAAVTLRYWYQDEGLGTALVFANEYVKIGYSIAATATGKVVAAPSPVAGADHYIELSFTGTVAPQGDKSSGDQFTLHVTAHTASYTGAVDITNDYSYDGGASKVYEKKITLHDKNGNVLWGTPPGGKDSTGPADGGS